MSQIINAIPPDALLPVAGAMVGWVGHMLWFRSERAHVAAGMARIRQFMRGNDEWLTGQQREFKAAEVTPEPLALSDRSHADEQAAHTDTDRAGMWRVLVGLGSDLVDRVHDWLPGLLTQWRERNDVGSGEQFGAEDPFAVDPDQPNDYDPVTGGRVQVVYPAPEPEPVQIVRVNHRYRDPGMTGQFPYVKVAGAPRHAAPEPEPEMPAINGAIPAQREAAE